MSNYYIFVEDGKLNGAGMARCISEGVECVEVDKNVYDSYVKDHLLYTWDGEKIIENPNYEAEKQAKEDEKNNNLTMTALDFVTFLRKAGISAEQIKAYLDNNIDLDMQLKYCQNVYFGVVRQLLPLEIGEIVITEDVVLEAFIEVNRS